MSIGTFDLHNQSSKHWRIHPKMFLLYISFGSMFMFFSALCSAIIVKKGDFKHWQDVVLPSVFTFSTIVIVFSSLTLELAKKFIHDNKAKFNGFSILTLFLAVLFLYLQLMGWSELKAGGILLKGNPSGSFIYIVSLFHGVHYIGGIIFLCLLWYKYRKGATVETQRLNFSILTQYWHYIGLVWVLLFLFFKLLIYK